MRTREYAVICEVLGPLRHHRGAGPHYHGIISALHHIIDAQGNAREGPHIEDRLPRLISGGVEFHLYLGRYYT